MSNKLQLDFIGIGPPRCATTWISDCLREHPEIGIVTSKTQPYSGYFSHFEDKKKRKHYEEHFQAKEGKEIIGEYNEFYFTDSKKVLRRIKKHNPNIKIVVSLRDPIERAYSSYVNPSSLQDKGWKSFRDALDKNPQIIENSLYYKHLRKWYDIFGADNILVVFTNDIGKDPVGFIQKIYKFLQVDPSFTPRTAELKISAAPFKLTGLGRFFHKKIMNPLNKIGLGWKIKRVPFLRRGFYKFANIYAKLKGSEKPPIKEEDKKYLRAIYKEDINKLEKLLNKDLSNWKK